VGKFLYHLVFNHRRRTPEAPASQGLFFYPVKESAAMMRPVLRVAPQLLATLFLIILVLGTGPPDRAASQTDLQQLERSAFSGGGDRIWNGTHKTVGTMGQPSPIGITRGRTTVIYSGFWSPDFDATSSTDLPGLVTRLEQNIPNPFNPSTRIEYQLAEDQFVSLEIFDLRGHRVQVLVHEQKSAGLHHAIWFGRDDGDRQVATGVYFYRLQAGQYRELKRMLLLK
jgi:hypothetical protein